jgi:hypothetical protein
MSEQECRPRHVVVQWGSISDAPCWRIVAWEDSSGYGGAPVRRSVVERCGTDALGAPCWHGIDEPRLHETALRDLAYGIERRRIEIRRCDPPPPPPTPSEYTGTEGFVHDLGCTVRECIDCGCLTPGGPTRCKRCALETEEQQEPLPESGSVEEQHVLLNNATKLAEREAEARKALEERLRTARAVALLDAADHCDPQRRVLDRSTPSIERPGSDAWAVVAGWLRERAKQEAGE